MGLVLGMALKFYASITKGLRVGKFRGQIPTFVKLYGKTGRGLFISRWWCPFICFRLETPFLGYPFWENWFKKLKWSV